MVCAKYTWECAEGGRIRIYKDGIEHIVTPIDRYRADEQHGYIYAWYGNQYYGLCVEGDFEAALQAFEDCINVSQTVDIGDITIEPSEGKQFVGLIQLVDPENTKETFLAFQWSNPVCVTRDESGQDIITNINDYKMANNMGHAIPSNLASKTRPFCIERCLAAGETITYQDVLDDAIAAGNTMPDGSTITGLINVETSLFTLNSTALDPVTGEVKKSQSQMITAEGKSVNAGGSFCEPHTAPLDEDCDGFVLIAPLRN